MNQEKIGKFIADKRKERNLTQEQLAEKLGVTNRAISNWENGKNMPDLSLFKPLCDELDISINDLFITPVMLKELIEMVDKKEISSKQAKDVFYKSLEDSKSPKDIVKEQGMTQIADDTELINIITSILDENEENIAKYKEGRTNVLDFFVGQVMKATRGKANPSMASSILKEEIEKR